MAIVSRFISSSNRELAHLAHHPLDIRLGRPKTRDTGSQDWRIVSEPDLGHPRNLALIKHRQESGGDQLGPCETYERERCRVDNLPPRSLQSLPKHVTHANLVIDHVNVTRFAMVSEREEELQSDKPPGPLSRRRVRIERGPGHLARHIRGFRPERLTNSLSMAAKEHPGSHRHREPLVRVAGNRICCVDTGQMAAKARRDDRSTAPSRIYVEPQIFSLAKARQFRQ